jgi:hypothetical protein
MTTRAFRAALLTVTARHQAKPVLVRVMSQVARQATIVLRATAPAILVAAALVTKINLTNTHRHGIIPIHIDISLTGELTNEIE